MKAYKGFDKDLKCRGFQYEIGKTYEEDNAELCKSGFHACEAPLDVLKYYSPAGGRYCEVELDDVSNERQSDDTKVVGKKITIGAEIGIPGLAKAHVEWVKETCNKSKEDSASGERGNAAASGWGGNAAASGERGNAAASGWRGNAAASGWGGNAAASGWGGNAAASGWRGNAAASGERGVACASGDYGTAEANGLQTIAIAWGNKSKAHGILGSWIVCAEYGNDDAEIVTAKMAFIDGEKIKPDTWYTLKDGEFVEVDDDAE